MPRSTVCGAVRVHCPRRFSSSANVLEDVPWLRKIPLDWVKPKVTRREPVSRRQPPVTQEEQRRVYLRRTRKSERDERMDITAGLTPVKDYMGGFTRPRELRSSNWWPGGPYIDKGKVYENPEPEAYEPHTVYLLETRYPIIHGAGRPIAVEHVTGMCRGNSLPSVLKHLNSVPTPGTNRTISKYVHWMDSALWPWSSKMKARREIWWTPDDRPNFWKDFHSGKISIDDIEERWRSTSFDECEPSPTPKMQTSVPEGTASFVIPPSISVDALDDLSQSLDGSQHHTRTKSSSKMPHPYGDYSTPTTIHSSSILRSLPSRNSGSPMAYQASSMSQSGPADKQNNLNCGPTPQEPPEALSPRASSSTQCSSDESTPPHSTSHGTKKPFKEEVDELSTLRTTYESTLSVAPFYLPILAITFSTRPLAATSLRLCRAHPRGLPFYASVADEDRKYGVSFGGRMRNMRIMRLFGLCLSTAKKLAGDRGGFIGLRFSPGQRGRGIGGEGFDDIMPLEKRKMAIQLGDWYKGHERDFEVFEEGIKGLELAEGSVDMRLMNQWGYGLDNNKNVLPGQDVSAPMEEFEDAENIDDDEADEREST